MAISLLLAHAGAAGAINTANDSHALHSDPPFL